MVSRSDLGAAPANARMDRMLLLLAPSPARQQALTVELTSLQNPASADYHQWLTASAFANAYADSASDVAAVAANPRGLLRRWLCCWLVWEVRALAATTRTG
ncbi:MAG: protease pro-enzyme activation domain-containing protein [Terracidiphilus sp.]